MEDLTRRHLLGLIGGVAGAAVAGGVVPGAVREAASAASPKKRRRYSTGMKAVVAAGTPLVGMSAPAAAWAARVSEVGAGLAARRIFADLSKGASDQIKLVEQTHAAGMLPVISYKVGGDPTGAAAGTFNDVAEQAAAKLVSFGRPTAVTFWHEPYGDLSAGDYVAASKQLPPFFKRGLVRVGPILNGWLLDHKQDLFAKSVADVGKTLLGTPNVWFGCVWNSTGGKGVTLTGSRLRAFKKTLADPRCGDPISR